MSSCEIGSLYLRLYLTEGTAHMTWLLTLLLSLLPSCPTEDSTNCYWDAQSRGNGIGTSFVDVGGVVWKLSSTTEWSAVPPWWVKPERGLRTANYNM